MLKNAVINNLVPEDKRDILFSTHISDDSDSEISVKRTDEIAILQDRIDKLEGVVRKLVDYLAQMKCPSCPNDQSQANRPLQ